MNKCIQINIKGKTFKFQNVNVSGAKTLGDILSRLSSLNDQNFIDFLNELDNNILDEQATPINSYTSAVVGETSPFKVLNALSTRGYINENLGAAISLISTSQKPIIKFTKGKDTRVLVGQDNTVILVNKDNLTSTSFINAIHYLYFDRMSRDVTSPVYSILDRGYRLLMEQNPDDAVLNAFEKMDIASRNKNFLAYVFKPEFRKNYNSIYTYILDQLNSQLNKALAVAKIIEGNSSNTELKKFIPLYNKDQVLDDGFTLAEAVDYINELRTLNEANLNTEWEKLKDVDEELYNRLENDTEYEHNLKIKIGSFSNIYMKKFTGERINHIYPDNINDLFVIRHAERLSKIIKKCIEEKTMFQASRYFNDMIANNTEVIKKEEKQLFNPNDLSIEADGNIIVKPTRSIRLTDTLPDRVLYVQSINDPDKFGKKHYSIVNKIIGKDKKTILAIDQNNFDGNINKTDTTKLKKQQTAYLTGNVSANTIKVLKNIGINFVIIPDGKNSVKNAHTLVNSGFDVSVIGAHNGDKYNFITPVDSSPLADTHNFYTPNSREGYEFTNKYGNKNLNDKLEQLEQEGNELNQLDLIQNGTINTIPVTNKHIDKYTVGEELTIIDEKTNKSIRARVDEITKFDGTLVEDTINNVNVGNLVTDDNSSYIVIDINENGDYVVIDAFRMQNSEPFEEIVSTISNDEMKDYKKLGTYPSGNGIIDYMEQYVITKNGYSKRNKGLTQGEKVQVYEAKISEISENSGFSVPFIRDKYLANTNMVKLTVLPNESLTRNYNLPKSAGFDFAMKLANRLGVTVNFVDKLQMRQFGDETAKGLVFNGEIFLNLDDINSQTLLHELTHIILAHLKESSYNDYVNLVSQVETDTELMNKIADTYPDLTYTDRLEEAFAEKVANSMNTKISDPKLDESLEKAGILQVIQDLFEIDNMDTTSIRDLMKSSLEQIISDNPELYNQYGPIFQYRAGINSDRISGIKSRLKKNNRLIEKCE